MSFLLNRWLDDFALELNFDQLLAVNGGCGGSFSGIPATQEAAVKTTDIIHMVPVVQILPHRVREAAAERDRTIPALLCRVQAV